MIGVLYAVILAQVVVAAWGACQDARTAAANKANAVLNLQRLSREWLETSHQPVRARRMAYAEHVVNVEWPALNAGNLRSAINPAPTDELWRIYDQIGLSPAGSTPTFAASPGPTRQAGRGPAHLVPAGLVRPHRSRASRCSSAAR